MASPGSPTGGPDPATMISRSDVVMSRRLQQGPLWRRVAKRVLRLVAEHVPTRRKVVLVAMGMVEDQLLAVYDEVRSRDARIRVSWIVDDVGLAERMLGRVLPGVPAPRFHRAWTVAALLDLLTARVVFFTVGLPGAIGPTRRRTVVNLWHGMPLKRVRGDDLVMGSEPIRAQLTTATSQFWVPHLAREFRQPEASIAPLGLPRNDRMLCPVDRAAQRRSLGLDPERPVVAFLPTYRSSPYFPGMYEGEESGTVTQIPGLDLPGLAALAERVGAQMVVKPHPVAYAGKAEPERDGDALLISNPGLAALGLTLSDLLAVSDVLVTDYSSVWIDYLLLERPIVFAIPDRAAYSDHRGFTLEGALELLPGPVAESLPDLERSLAAVLGGDDEHKSARAEALLLHHDVRDGSSTRRVLDATVRLSPGVLPSTPSQEGLP